MKFGGPGAEGLSEAYAKVMKVGPANGDEKFSQMNLAFTSLPEDCKSFLANQRAAAAQENPSAI